jgi:hypothetical protein
VRPAWGSSVKEKVFTHSRFSCQCLQHAVRRQSLYVCV